MRPSIPLRLNEHGLVIIGMERSGKQGAPKFGDGALDPLVGLIKFGREKNLQVIFFNSRPGYEILPGLTDAAGRKTKVVLGPEKDKFKNSGLDEMLREQGVTNVIIGGLDADIDVKHTAAGAIKNGYWVASAREVLYSPDRFPQYANIQLIDSKDPKRTVDSEQFYQQNVRLFDACEHLTNYLNLLRTD